MFTRRIFLVLVLFVLSALLLVACTSATVQANAGDDFSVREGAAPTFDGCGSSGQIVTYEWRIVAAPAGREAAEGNVIQSAADCTFELGAQMVVDDMGEWVIELSVVDGEGNRDSDRVTVVVVGG